MLLLLGSALGYNTTSQRFAGETSSVTANARQTTPTSYEAYGTFSNPDYDIFKRQNSGFVTGFPCNRGMGLQCNYNGRTACCAAGSKCMRNPNCACPGCCPDGQVCNECPAVMGVAVCTTICADGNAGTPTPMGYPYPTNFVFYRQAPPQYGVSPPPRWISRMISWALFGMVEALPFGDRRDARDLVRDSAKSSTDRRREVCDERHPSQTDANNKHANVEVDLGQHYHSHRHHQRRHHLHQRQHPRDLEVWWPIFTFDGTLTSQYGNKTTLAPFVGSAESSAPQAQSTIHTTRTVTVAITEPNSTMVSTPQPTVTSTMAPEMPQSTAPLTRRCDLRRRKGQA
jgi:hypothetical protein